jgi:hypothetical protein
MFITRHLFLYGAVAATLTATAQEMLELQETRSVVVRESDGGQVTTIVISMDTVAVIEALDTAEGMAMLLADQMAEEYPAYAEVPEPPAHPAVACMPALCQVVVQVERVDAPDQGAPKAEVFRYRYKQKPTTVPVHSVVDDTVDETGAGDGSEKAAMPVAAQLSADDLRVLPNPSAGVFTLAFPLPDEGGNGELYVTDAAGRVVHHEAVMGQGGQARVIDLTGEGKGTYVATVVLGDRTISKRLVIE